MALISSAFPRLMASTILILASVIGCSTHQGYWPSDPPIGKATSCQGASSTIQSTTIQYEREGHYNTTELIARMAGYGKADALRLAFFSQAPDDLEVKYSAPWVGVWGLVPRLFLWSYHSNIMNVLHSLHDGDHAEVLERRNKLKAEIAYLVKENKEANAWKIGFLIHALGDSYAHTRGGMANLHGYNEFIGHMLDNWAHGNKPDEIVVNNNYLIYIEFVTALFESLKRDETRADRNVLSLFIKAVRARVEDEQITEDKLTEFISNYSACLADQGVSFMWKDELRTLSTTASMQRSEDEEQVAKPSRREESLEKEISERKAKFKQWEEEISFWEVVRFLKEIRYRI